MVRKLVVAGAFAAFGFAVAGPLQHLGVLPETALGNASKAAIKSALNISVEKAWACRGGGGGGGGGGPRGNNGWGNGEHMAPGNSLSNQPKFEDPNTGPSPSNSPRSGGGDR